MDIKNLNNKERKNRRQSSIDLSTMVYGKVPPQAKELEEAILGAILQEKQAFEKALRILQPECFYVDAHQRIFKSMIRLESKNAPIDILTVVEELKSKEELEIVGGPYYVTKLTNSVVSSANLEYHAKIIYQKFVQREIIRVSGEAISEAYEDSADAFETLEAAQQQLSSLTISKKTKPYTTFQTEVDKAVKQVYEVRQSGNELTGVPSGIRKLDLITQGWQNSDFIVFAARPAIGKSAVAANFAMNAASHPDKPTPVGVFTLEMSSVQWALRMISAESEIDMYHLKRGRVTDNDMNRLSEIAYTKHRSTPIFFDDTPSQDLYQLKAKCRLMVANEGVGLIIIDYLQLMTSQRSFGENREQEVSRISRELKQLAKELNIPVIALSQLSRKGDSPNPGLSDIRESGAIEQDADAVFFLIEVTEDDIRNDASLMDSILVKVAKHRNGIKEQIPIKFVKSIQKLMSESDYDVYKAGKSTGGWKKMPSIDIDPNKFNESNSKEMPF
ncbi:replicative DNA helicase [Flavitalea sp.]|nr:replicative DNA helicase [Flavitalea sp.]